jgi:hypothetical protein
MRLIEFIVRFDTEKKIMFCETLSLTFGERGRYC